ncbi:MAG: Fe3+/spermidine/putrescine ABC transporter ATP-binding protein [Anaeromyxobacter sp. RBG_16_69_14]|nr:MAG: Fe3+/spermidine/putrescine ABC transporter ATP-binding protein [Anaeromyxobacter sp. RBG_16_69_14]
MRPDARRAGPSLAFDLERHFRDGPVVRAALEVPLDAEPVTVLFGPSGSGKTTVLRCLAGLDRPERGFIRFRDETWFDAATRGFVPPQRRGVGLLFQEYALFPHLSVAANIGFGLARAPRAERNARVLEVARFLRIEELLDRRPARISGGQRQRVALARSLAPRPRLLLLDEPLSALDGPTREELRGELRSLLEHSGIPSLVVTHDRVEALALGDRLAVLAEGSVRQVGPVHEVFSAPADLVVARVVGTENVAPASIVSRDAGLALVRVGTAQLLALDPGGLHDEAFACIRAEEVVLETAPGTPTSARNELTAEVRTVSPEGPLVRVTLDCGFRLVTLVTRRSADRLALAPGSRAVALVKASAIRLVPRAS